MRKAAIIGAALAGALFAGSAYTLPDAPRLSRPTERTERVRFGAGASKKRRRPRPKIWQRGARYSAKCEARDRHRETVKLQQAAGFEWQRRRKELERRGVDNLSDHDTLRRLGEEWRARQQVT